MFPKADIHPIVFDEVYILDKTAVFSNNNLPVNETYQLYIHKNILFRSPKRIKKV